MKSKLYKLALWYIEKCNREWDKRNYEDKLKALDRLTYWNFGKYMLVYGADAEWRIFSRYEVLDNAIQKLAKYENEEQEIRNKAIDDMKSAWDNRVKDLIKWCKDKRLSGLEQADLIFDEIADEMRGAEKDEEN